LTKIILGKKLTIKEKKGKKNEKVKKEEEEKSIVD
jgi:hypothetical protein